MKTARRRVAIALAAMIAGTVLLAVAGCGSTTPPSDCSPLCKEISARLDDAGAWTVTSWGSCNNGRVTIKMVNFHFLDPEYWVDGKEETLTLPRNDRSFLDRKVKRVLVPLVAAEREKSDREEAQRAADKAKSLADERMKR